VVYRGKLLVLLFYVGGEKVEVHTDRCQAGVSQYFLQAKDITAVEQVIPGESMAEGVGRTPHSCDADSFTVTAQHLLDTVSGKG